MAYDKKLTVPKNMRLAYLPPYSPELNQSNILWDCIRENWFSNKTFKSIDAVEDTLVEGLVALERMRREFSLSPDSTG